MIVTAALDELMEKSGLYPRRVLRGFAATLGVAVGALAVAIGAAFLNEPWVALSSTFVLGAALILNSSYIEEAQEVPLD